MSRGQGLDHQAALLGLLAAGSVGNALWMLAAPLHWYGNLPAYVPDFGPYNSHFVQDIGSAYLAAGVAMGWAALRPALRFPLTVVAAVFYGLHAVGHVVDTASGRVGAHHWLADVPGVYLPAVLLMLLAFTSRGARDPVDRSPRTR